MNYLNEKLFNFFSTSKILKIIIIFTLLSNINCNGDNMVILFEDQIYRPPSFNIIYDANGGSGTLPSDTNGYLDGESVTVLNHGTLINAGLSFICWNTEADGSGTDMTEGSTFNIGTADVTLYAKWAILSNVTYDASGGSGPLPSDTNDYFVGESVTVLNHGTLINGGLSFICWNTEADGSGTDMAEGSTFTIGAADVTLYAKWGVLSGELGILDVSGTNPNTGLAWQAGDTYRLIFISSTAHNAVSTNINDYNNFVQTLANSAGLGSVNWYVIGSTQTVNARTNTLTRVGDVDGPMFLLDGTTRVANNNADLWDASIWNVINIDENKNLHGAQIFTGTNSDGNASTNRWLGSTTDVLVTVGRNNPASDTGSYWMSVWRNPPTHTYSFYAMSEVLTVDFY